MTQKTSLSFVAKLLLALLAMQLVIIIAIFGTLFFDKAAQSQYAFDTGRFITIDVKTGKVQGNIAVSEKKGLSEEEYRLKRIEELTGKSTEEIKQEIAKASTPDNTTPLTKEPVLSTPSRTVLSPLTLDYHSELVEKTPTDLSLPQISKDKKFIPWRTYAKPAPSEKGIHQLSVVITNLGLNPAATEQALEMNEYVTLAFSPYARDVSQQIKVARASGFETWLTFPLQHENYPVHDYGPYTLLEELSPEDNIHQLHTLLHNNHGIAGLVALPDEKFSRSTQMGHIFEEIDKRGLLLTLYHPFFSPNTTTYGGVLRARPHIHGGNVPPESAELFRMIEAQAMSEKHTIITMAAMPKLMQEMNQWIASLPAKNITLIPLSAHMSEE
jgi:polysaccharide deacetylase 2 family uncharacterized protein YibQ